MYNMNFRFYIVAIAILLFAGCHSGNKEIKKEDSVKKGNVASDLISQNKFVDGEKNADTDSVFYYYKKAKLLPETTKAFKIIETLDSSKLGVLDFYACEINDEFCPSRIERITPVLLYYVDVLFQDITEYYMHIYNENFDNLPEPLQRVDVQSEMNSRENKLKRAKNILEAVLSTNTERRPQALLLYGNVLYNLGDYEDEVENVYAEYYKMMQEKGLTDEVPEYVTDPAERRIIGEDW